MSRYNSKKSGIRFLLFLIIFGYGCIRLTKNVDGNIFDIEKTVDEVAQVCTTCGNGQEEKVLPEENNYVVYDFTEEQVVDITEEVKAASSGKNVCTESANVIDKVRRLCKTNSAEINYLERLGANPIGGGGGGDIDVSKITGFKLTKVTYPLAFWLGKYIMETSNKEITTKDPAYSSNGQQIDINYQLKTLSPQQSKELEKVVTVTERKPFDVMGKLEVAGADEVQENTDGKYTVSNAPHDPVCGCPTEVSTTDYNVGTSNYLGSKAGGYDRQQIPGGDNYSEGIDNECISRSNIKEVTVGLLEGCRKTPSFFKGLFSNVFTQNQWQKCTNEGLEECTTDPKTGKQTCTSVHDNCISERDLTVLMSPIFGEVFNCEEDECANAFLTYAYKGTLSPEQSSSKKEVAGNNNDSLMYFIATDCEAEIDMAGGESKILKVKCLWDATPTLMNYKLQAKDKIPGQENFPKTFEQYWSRVEVAIGDSAIKYGL